jgi:hypothetical protein
MRRPLLAMVLVCLLIMGTRLIAQAADPFIPERPADAPQYGPQVPLYDRAEYPPWAYTLDARDSTLPDYATLYARMNQMLVAKAWFLKLSLRSVEYALGADLVQPFIQHVGVTLEALGNAFWEADGAPLVVGALALTGLWALWLYLCGNSSRAWTALGGTTLVLLAAAVVLANGSSALSAVHALARGAAQQAYGVVDQISLSPTATWRLLPQSGDDVWRTLVYEPWVTGELSEEGRVAFRSTDGLDGGTILAGDQEQRRYQCTYNTSEGNRLCPWWTVEFLPRRMLLASVSFVAAVIYGGALFGLSGLIILSQFTLVFLVTLTPVWLLIALWWPEGGVRLLQRIFLRGLGALVSQAVLAVTLATLLSFSHIVVSAFAASGWMLQSLMLVALAIVAFRYRYAWLVPVTVPVRSPRDASEWLRISLRSPGSVAGTDAQVARKRHEDGAAFIPEFRDWAFQVSSHVETEAVTGRIEVSAPADEPPPRLITVDVFQHQMRLLREQLHIREQTVTREGLTVLSKSYQMEEPAPSLRPEQRSVRTLPRSSAGLQLPSQRPKDRGGGP